MQKTTSVSINDTFINGGGTTFSTVFNGLLINKDLNYD